MDSERILNCKPETRWLYVCILLQADDVGLFEATPFKLARKADVNRDGAETMIAELVGQDLIRLYKVDGKALGFIPRFKQRLQIKRTKFPLPPAAVLHGDPDALNKIKHLTLNPPLDTVGHRKTPSEPEPEPEEIKRKRLRPLASNGPVLPKKPRTQKAQPLKVPVDDIVRVFHEVLPELPGVKLMPAKRRAALQKFWEWILSSKKPDGTPRATTPEEALVWVRAYFDRVRHNEFLMGTTKRTEEHANWRCSLDHLLTDKGMLHVIERTETS